MAQLIAMRQRIKAVETIKKMTHAMRLISMSTHSRLRHKKVHLEQYKNAFQQLWYRVHTAIALPTEGATTKSPQHLIILIGSNKGLCGTFNSALFRFFEEHERTLTADYHFITVGRYATTYVQQKNSVPLAAYTSFTSAHYVTIAQAITTLILQTPTPYTHVTVYSNYSKSFFVQRPEKTTLIPFKEPEVAVASPDTSEYLFEQSPEELSSIIQQLMLSVTLQEILFESLLAEQAARFLSMDSSTRNADNLLISMKLDYNKSRQSAITRELTELSSSY